MSQKEDEQKKMMRRAQQIKESLDDWRRDIRARESGQPPTHTPLRELEHANKLYREIYKRVNRGGRELLLYVPDLFQTQYAMYYKSGFHTPDEEFIRKVVDSLERAAHRELDRIRYPHREEDNNDDF